MNLEAWRAFTQADADRRGLSDLKPLLDMLMEATATLRRADWNDEADRPLPPPRRSGP